jgi:hypothetical protein
MIMDDHEPAGHQWKFFLFTKAGDDACECGLPVHTTCWSFFSTNAAEQAGVSGEVLGVVAQQVAIGI